MPARRRRPWDFDLHEVTGPVEWWHGEEDTSVSPHVTTHFVEGGHHVLFAHAEEVMTVLGRRPDA